VQNIKDNQISEDFHRLTNECEICLENIVGLREPKADNSETLVISKNFQEKLSILGSKLKRVIMQHIADDFIDLFTPVKKLGEVALSPFGM
jgi:hypothetical protein